MAELSLKDLKNQVNFMIARFQDNVKTFETLEGKIKTVLASMDPLEKDFNALSKFYENLFSQVSSTIKRFESNFKEQDTKIQSIKNSNDILLHDHKEVVLTLNNFFQNLSNLETKTLGLLNYQNNLVKNKDFIESNSKIESSLKSHLNLLNSIKKDFDNLTKLYKDSDFIQSVHYQDIEALKKNLDSVSSMFGSHLLNFDMLKDQVRRENELLKSSFQKYVSDQISTIPKPESSISLDDAKAAMQGKLDPVVLDAKNANLRSVNNETKIILLEKKVEQLQLLITKMQLKG